MERLIQLAKLVTGKDVNHADWTWYQDKHTIWAPKGDYEGLLHEIAHWVVATDYERRQANLFLDTNKSSRVRQRELETCWLSRQVYAAAGIPFPANSSCCDFTKDLSEKAHNRVLARLAALQLSFIEEAAAALESGACLYV